MPRVAIVGGGPSGIYALRELLRHNRVVSVTLFEAGEKPGLGTPYDPALNHPSLLANIASFELPPVVESLGEWLRRLSARARRKLNVDTVSAREFYPRVVLGAYFTAQYRKLARVACARLDLRAGGRVVDVACRPGEVSITSERDGALAVETFDFALLATGHRSRAHATVPLCAPAYPPPQAPPARAMRIAVLGASLTAIDAALSIALQRGDFVAAPEGLHFRTADGAAPFAIEMLSRRGLLPEADFYFPYPYEPLRYCHTAALQKLGEASGERLDLAFDLFRRELLAEDPDYARRIDLSSLDADGFADAYFRAREGADPFESVRRNLAQARAGVRDARVSPYRYAILRAHEAFAELVPKLSEREAKRFRRGLQRVFVDNYAAVPPLSVERLLALNAAGVLGLRKIAPGYGLEKAGDGVEIVEPGRRERYDLVVEARGETAAAARELPFPTLRLQILANQIGRSRADIEVTDQLQLAPGLNPVDRVYCLAAPFLLSRRPFVQGLTSAQELATQAVRHLLRGASAPALKPESLMNGGAIYLDGGLVVTTPAHIS